MPHILQLAEEYATQAHTGQLRMDGATPFIEHPRAVVSLLENFGITDEDSLTIGWLHDTIEDTDVMYEDIYKVFGKTVADGVQILTRDVDRATYKTRLLGSSIREKFVKLCDTLHNVLTLDAASYDMIKRKVDDSLSFYIPMARELNPQIAHRLNQAVMKEVQKDLSLLLNSNP